MISNTEAIELREKLKGYSVTDIARVAKLMKALVAGFMDGNNDLGLEEIQRLEYAERQLSESSRLKNTPECDCPACVMRRIIEKHQSLEGADIKQIDLGGTGIGGVGVMLLKIESVKLNKAAKKPKPTFWQNVLRKLKISR